MGGDLANAESDDCNENGTPDECEFPLGGSLDCALFRAKTIGLFPFGPFAGETWSEAGCLRVLGGQGELSTLADTFHFAHVRLAGNFRLTARVEDWSVKRDHSKLGLMIRENLKQDARFGAMVLNRLRDDFLPQFLRRETAGKSVRSTTLEARPESPKVWLRVERRGETLSGCISLDGLTWTEPESLPFEALPEEVYVGVASSYAGTWNGGGQSLAQICELSLERPSDGPDFVRGDCDGDGDACSGVSDALELLSWLFLGRTEPPCLAACDPDGNGTLELADAVYGLNFCFAGTDAPVAPFPACGVGTEADMAMGCETSNCQ